MSLSELFSISQTVRRDKARQQDLLPVSSSNSSAPARICNICYAKPATYNCPRCNVPFCSTACFRKREHQECSNAFSSSAIISASAAASKALNVDESDRRKVVDILGRLERDEKEARQMQSDQEDEDEDDNDDDDDNGGADCTEARAAITEEQIEGASADALLAMLAPKERQRFLEAIKDPHKALSLLERLDRNAERRARMQSPQSAKVVPVVPPSSSDSISRPISARRECQFQPWFETPDASFKTPGALTERSSSFIASLEEILLAPRTRAKNEKEKEQINLVYNLCAVLMAYGYTLRHLDIVSLSGRSGALACQLVSSSRQVSSVPTSEQIDDDGEPPPLEPDNPIGAIPDPATMSSSTQTALPSASRSQTLLDPSVAEQAFKKLCQLVPFLCPHLFPSKTTQAAGANVNHSKTVLTSLDDASMWLLSRLSLESEVGQAGADAISLQLLEDLAKLLTHERLVPSFGQGSGVDPKYRLASRLASVSPQQAFVAAQTPLLLNAVADLYFFLEDLSLSNSGVSSPSSTRIRPVYPKLAQRKLSFYLCSALNADPQFAQSTTSAILPELQDHIQTLRHRIDAANQADRIAAAVNLFSSDHAPRANPPRIEEAS